MFRTGLQCHGSPEDVYRSIIAVVVKQDAHPVGRLSPFVIDGMGLGKRCDVIPAPDRQAEPISGRNHD